MFRTIAFIGSGSIGGTLARLSVAAGLDVIVSNSRSPDTLADLVADLGGHACATTCAQAATTADLVVVTVPFHAYRRLPVAALAGRIVVDTMNYYPERDEQVPELDAGEVTSSELVQRYLVDARVVKALNNVDFMRLSTAVRPPGAPDRSALPIASDDAAAKAVVAEYLSLIGYDTIDMGALVDSWRSEPGTPIYLDPYLSRAPRGMDEEQARRWFRTSPAVPLPAARARELVAEAVRAGARRGSFTGLPPGFVATIEGREYTIL
ncbi:NADPH-dependent F420 reductase [Nocardia sp. alder85J]|uniref:NADPH-dependent F420 reductase n=1 Tax=Nocardia sp. alder85J TaxID=2862949 RepID=UPI001CD2A11C|nr:NAD(P)-binding domain-containing protein [Nocardia sp. alder85J]MCX4099190.1 NAD(P)-binding domain-containing protein [Nocardia sp. alder85J]